MTTVTKESLAERIQHLEDLGSMISLNEEYQLAAYRMLVDLLPLVEYGPAYWITYHNNPEPDEYDDREHSHSGAESCARRIAKEIGGSVRPVYFGQKENP
ncbi:MAG: hypothetical protein ACRCZO_16235 [Cetobacterium sp.]